MPMRNASFFRAQAVRCLQLAATLPEDEPASVEFKSLADALMRQAERFAAEQATVPQHG